MYTIQEMGTSISVIFIFFIFMVFWYLVCQFSCLTLEENLAEVEIFGLNNLCCFLGGGIVI